MLQEWESVMTEFIPDEMLTFTVEKNSEDVFSFFNN